MINGPYVTQMDAYLVGERKDCGVILLHASAVPGFGLEDIAHDFLAMESAFKRGLFRETTYESL